MKRSRVRTNSKLRPIRGSWDHKRTTIKIIAIKEAVEDHAAAIWDKEELEKINRQ